MAITRNWEDELKTMTPAERTAFHQLHLKNFKELCTPVEKAMEEGFQIIEKRIRESKSEELEELVKSIPGLQHESNGYGGHIFTLGDAFQFTIENYWYMFLGPVEDKIYEVDITDFHKDEYEAKEYCKAFPGGWPGVIRFIEAFNALKLY